MNIHKFTCYFWNHKYTEGRYITLAAKSKKYNRSHGERCLVNVHEFPVAKLKIMFNSHKGITFVPISQGLME